MVLQDQMMKKWPLCRFSTSSHRSSSEASFIDTSLKRLNLVDKNSRDSPDIIENSGTETPLTPPIRKVFSIIIILWAPQYHHCRLLPLGVGEQASIVEGLAFYYYLTKSRLWYTQMLDICVNNAYLLPALCKLQELGAKVRKTYASKGLETSLPKNFFMLLKFVCSTRQYSWKAD